MIEDFEIMKLKMKDYEGMFVILHAVSEKNHAKFRATAKVMTLAMDSGNIVCVFCCDSTEMHRTVENLRGELRDSKSETDQRQVPDPSRVSHCLQ